MAGKAGAARPKSVMQPNLQAILEARLPAEFVRRRLAIEGRFNPGHFSLRKRFFKVESWWSFHSVVRNSMRLVGVYGRALRNAADVRLRENVVRFPNLPPAFDGFTLLQMTDLHADMCPGAMQRTATLLEGLRYDLCVITGDFRGANYGDYGPALEAVERLRARISTPVYAVLGNHDPLAMVPPLEAMGIAVLVNEVAVLARGDARIHMAGIDDAHFFGTHDIPGVRAAIPPDAFAILLSHTPETYAEAADAGFDFMLSGHTHGGQICLPGSIPLMLDSPGMPRRYGAGAWRHGNMTGFTSRGTGSSLQPVRLNCPPEIVLHRLVRG